MPGTTKTRRARPATRTGADAVRGEAQERTRAAAAPVATPPDLAPAGDAVVDEVVDPRVEALVQELIGRVADKWTMIVLELLGERGRQRFTQIAHAVPGISQKMLTQTLRQMERDGLLTRTVHAVVPPRVEYALTPLGQTLGAAFCGVWVWAAAHRESVERARAAYDAAAAAARAQG